MGYSLGQVIVFTWRDNEVVLLGLKQAQVTAIAVMAVTSIVFLWYSSRQNKKIRDNPD